MVLTIIPLIEMHRNIKTDDITQVEIDTSIIHAHAQSNLEDSAECEKEAYVCSTPRKEDRENHSCKTEHVHE